MPLLNQYRIQYPDVDLDFATGFEANPHELLQTGEFDLLITADPIALKGVEYFPVFEYESRLVLSNTHPLVRAQEITVQELAEETLVTYPVDKHRLDIMSRLFIPANILPKQIRTTDLTQMLIQLVASGRGIAALPDWVVRQIREHKWSLDACCGYAKRHDLFEPSEMVCSRTLYNMVWKGHLSIQPMELPEALKRKAKKHRVRENKKRYGTSISSRPEIASLRLEEGHWECDTVVGKRAGKEAVVFSLLEKKTETYLAFRIPGKTSEAVMNLMNALHDEYGERFSQVFKTITVIWTTRSYISVFLVCRRNTMV